MLSKLLTKPVEESVKQFDFPTPVQEEDIETDIKVKIMRCYLLGLPTLPYIAKNFAETYKIPEPDQVVPSTDPADPTSGNWTFPRGRNLIGDPPREDYRPRQTIFFWDVLLDIFDGKTLTLPQYAVDLVRQSWKNLYAAFLREKEKKLRREREDVLNINYENMTLDELFDMLDEIDEKHAAIKKVGIKKEKKEEEDGPGVWIGRQPFTDIVKGETFAYQKKLFANKPIKKEVD